MQTVIGGTVQEENIYMETLYIVYSFYKPKTALKVKYIFKNLKIKQGEQVDKYFLVKVKRISGHFQRI